MNKCKITMNIQLTWIFPFSYGIAETGQDQNSLQKLTCSIAELSAFMDLSPHPDLSFSCRWSFGVLLWEIVSLGKFLSSGNRLDFLPSLSFTMLHPPNLALTLLCTTCSSPLFYLYLPPVASHLFCCSNKNFSEPSKRSRTGKIRTFTCGQGRTLNSYLFELQQSPNQYGNSWKTCSVHFRPATIPLLT